MEEVDKFKNKALDWQLAFNREESAHMDLKEDYKVWCFKLEREMEIRLAGWNDLLTCMQSLKFKIEEAEALRSE